MTAMLTRLRQGDRWIPAMFFLFFLVVFSVNGVFIYLANTTWVGLVTEDPYHRGVNYNEVLAAERAQQSLGWSHELALDVANISDGVVTGVVTMTLTDRNNAPLDGGEVAILMERAGRFSQVFRVPLEPVGQGRYSAEVTLPVGGNWHMTTASRIDGQTYRAVDEIFVGTK